MKHVLTAKIRKPIEARKARFYYARGYSMTAIARMLHVRKQTVMRWCGGGATQAQLHRLVVRLVRLPREHFDKVMTKALKRHNSVSQKTD